MSIRLAMTFLAATFAFGSAPRVTAGGGSMSDTRTGDATLGITMPAASGQRDAVAQVTGLFRPSPVGHRQPRENDVPPAGELSPSELELRREDREIDRKLIICRGC